MRLVVSKAAAPKFKQNLAGIADRIQAALIGAANMAASLIQSAARDDIAKSGNFGGKWITGLHVDVEGGSIGNMRIAMYHDDPRAAIFEHGGVIHGSPLLWLPLGSQPRLSDGGGGDLFSGVSSTGQPLLFGRDDRRPRYIGVPQVSISKRFHLEDVQNSVMGRFKQLFDDQFKTGGSA